MRLDEKAKLKSAAEKQIANRVGHALQDLIRQGIISTDVQVEFSFRRDKKNERLSDLETISCRLSAWDAETGLMLP